MPDEELRDLGYRYLTAPTVDAGIDEVLPALIGRRHLFASVARLVEAEAVEQGGATLDAALLRATAHAFAGDSDMAGRLVRDARPIPAQVKLAWIERLGNLISRHPGHHETLDRLRLRIIACTEADCE